MSQESKAALLPVLHGQYGNILSIEEEWGIRFAEGDHRPRIEYFHDAVRALTSGTADLHGKHSRLSVEHLAYDLAMLRQVQSKPAGIINKATDLSAGSDLVTADQAGATRQRKPDRATRNELATLYKDYTVIFAAIFAEIADLNFKSREEEMDENIADIGLVESVLQQLTNGQMTKEQAEAALDEVEMDELREKMIAAIRTKKKLGLAEMEQITAQLKGIEGAMKAEMQKVDTAHLHYATARLAVYEESKDTVKRLAAQGMNLAGKFVDQALGQSAGKGAGLGM